MKQIFLNINHNLTFLVIIILLVSSNSNLIVGGPENDFNISGERAIESSYSISTENINLSSIEFISDPDFSNISNINDSRIVDIAVENENIYVVWTDNSSIFGAGDDYDIFYKFYNGIIWSDIQILSEPVVGKDNNIGISWMPRIAVENERIYVVWYDTNDTNNCGGDLTDSEIFYRCNLTGTYWEPVQILSEPIPNEDTNILWSSSPVIAVENGKLYVVWADDNNTYGSAADTDIFFRCNLTGTHWEPVQILSEPIYNRNLNYLQSLNPEIAVEHGMIYVVWEDSNDTDGAGGLDKDIFYICNLTGTRWGPIEVISEPKKGSNNNYEDSYQPSIAVEHGRIYVVWADLTDYHNAGYNCDMFYRCNLTGTHWEPIQIISEPVPNQDFHTGWCYFSDIEVENYKIHLVWGDRNDTNGAGTDNDIFYKCNVTGIGWEPELIISEPTQGSDINKGISNIPKIAYENFTGHVAWDDTNNTPTSDTEQDIFYRNFSYPSNPLSLMFPKVTPTYGNTGTNFNFTITYIHLNSKPPVNIVVNLNGINHSMLESIPIDSSYKDGKDYYFSTRLNISNDHTFQFWADDGTRTVSTMIINRPNVHNSPPIITTYSNPLAYEDTYYEVVFEYEDIDEIHVGQSVEWNFSTNATWLKFNHSSGILNGTPENDDVGIYWINISVFDPFSIDYLLLPITVAGINDPPVIITDDVTVAIEDKKYEVYYNVLDIDTISNNLYWNLETNASWLGIDKSVVKIEGTPENPDVGIYWVNISVWDLEFTDFSNFTLKVMNVNDPPKIVTEDITIAIEDELYQVNYQAIDVDDKPGELIWNMDTNAEWLMFNEFTSMISGTPMNSDVDDYWVNISVSDFEYIDSTNFTLTVENINDPPVISTSDRKLATIGVSYSIQYKAEDVDSLQSKLRWSVSTNANDWLSINPYTGWLNGTPNESNNDIKSSYGVTVTVSDGDGGQDLQSFKLLINHYPVLNTSFNTIGYAEALYSVTIHASDDRTPENDLNWSLYTNASWLHFNQSSRSLFGRPQKNEIGNYWVNIFVSDQEGGFVNYNFTLSVEVPQNTEPELSQGKISPDSGNTKTEFTFSVYYYDKEGDKPDFIQVVIDGEVYDMRIRPDENASDGVYELSLKLPVGYHQYYFKANDRKLDAMAGDTSTPINDDTAALTPKVTEPAQKEEAIGFNWMQLSIIFIIILFLMLVCYIHIKKHVKTKELNSVDDKLQEDVGDKGMEGTLDEDKVNEE
jgi:hypothetical protein